MPVSKLVSRRQHSADQVVKAARSHMGRVGVGMAKLLGPDSGTAAEKLMGAWADKLEKATKRLVEMDKAQLESDLDFSSSSRHERDAAASQLRIVLDGLRDRLSLLFGSDFVRSMGFLGQTPHEPVRLRRLGQRVADKIMHLEPPPSRVAGMRFDPESWQKKILYPLERLDSALDTIAVETLESEPSISAKRRAVQDHDELMRKSGAVISALLSVAGEESVADRVHSISSIPEPAVEAEAFLEPEKEDGEEAHRDTLPSGMPSKTNRLSKWF